MQAISIQTAYTIRVILIIIDMLILFLEDKVINPHFFIFNDDLIWAKENLDFFVYRAYVEFDQDIPDHEKMTLISLCKHNIIAYSSFSWWVAWLNKVLNKIVTEQHQWFQVNPYDTHDQLPSSWVAI